MKQKLLKAIYDNFVNLISFFNDIIKEEQVFLSEDIQRQCGNECKYICDGNRN